MPEGYDPIEQVFINSMVNVYLPQLKRWGIPVLLLLIGGIYLLLRRRRRQR
jgi:cytochrome c-type biogenesis protein CcmH/NrfF